MGWRLRLAVADLTEPDTEAAVSRRDGHTEIGIARRWRIRST